MSQEIQDQQIVVYYMTCWPFITWSRQCQLEAGRLESARAGQSKVIYKREKSHQAVVRIRRRRKKKKADALNMVDHKVEGGKNDEKNRTESSS